MRRKRARSRPRRWRCARWRRGTRGFDLDGLDFDGLDLYGLGLDLGAARRRGRLLEHGVEAPTARIFEGSTARLDARGAQARVQGLGRDAARGAGELVESVDDQIANLPCLVLALGLATREAGVGGQADDLGDVEVGHWTSEAAQNQPEISRVVVGAEVALRRILGERLTKHA